MNKKIIAKTENITITKEVTASGKLYSVFVQDIGFNKFYRADDAFRFAREEIRQAKKNNWYYR